MTMWRAVGRFLDWYEADESWRRGVVTLAFLVGLWGFCLGVNYIFYLIGIAGGLNR